MLYKKDTYLKDVDYLVNHEIYEYDISSAGYNISKYYNLLPDDILEEISNITDKNKRVVKLGLLQRENRDFKDKLKEGFINIRKEFFESNNIKDDEILSIKKDAIFTLKPCTHTEFGNVVFKNKNYYTSYYRFYPHEFYYGDNKVDIKGISEVNIVRHKDYMIDFLIGLFKRMEISKESKTIKYLVEFINYYKLRQLSSEYYRELDNRSRFRLLKPIGDNIFMDEAVDKNLLDISYNYMTYLVPMIQYLY